MRQLKVLIADGHRLMLEALRGALEGAPDLEIVAETQSGTRVLPLVAQTEPDVVVLDVRMPEMDGLRCLERITQRYPKVTVVMLSASEDPRLIEAALQRGASSFVLKRVDPRDLPSALRQAVDGTVVQYLRRTQGASEGGAAEELGLTERELSVLRALASGLSNKQIASRLWLAEQTVKFHLTSIYRKLAVATRAEAIRYAYEHGLAQHPILDEDESAAEDPIATRSLPATPRRLVSVK